MNLGTFLQDLLTLIANDEKAVVLPLVVTLITDLKGNTSALNIAAQLNAFLAALVAAQGTVESQLLNQILALIQGQITAAQKATAK